ncbi:MAG: cell division protein FtsQ [Flavobacterium sp.]|nr:cell division protein FtsQ [Flavobacterium sp.]
MKNFNWQIIRLILIFGFVIFLYSFSLKRNENRNLTKSEVVFVGANNLFVKQETVNNMLIDYKESASNIKKENLDLLKLEKTIDKQPMIEKSQVFVTIDGVLKAVVKQKTPIARLFQDNTSTYIDYQGNTMPISDLYTARVPLISGEINNQTSQQLIDLFRLIYDDEFLKKNIIGMQILPNGSLKMKNRNYDFDIFFGNPINIEEKFKNYKAFYQKASIDKTLNNYKSINLQFTQQVVCTK